MDASYEEVARVRAGNGLQGDHHEFIISPEDTALFDIYHRVPMDLSDMGGEADSTVLDGIVQEVDIEPGEVLSMGARHVVNGLEPLLIPARPLGDTAPLPYYLATGLTVVVLSERERSSPAAM